MPLSDPERIMQRFTERACKEVYDFCARNGFKTSAVKKYTRHAACVISHGSIDFSLENAFGILLKDAECNEYFDVAERHLCYKQFRSACGVYIVFAKHGGSRPGEETPIQFVRGEHDGKMYLHCRYVPNGPSAQIVRIMLVPFEKCAGCHERKAGLLMCAACKAIDRRVLYCGRDCQRAHWRKHTAVCGRE